MPRPSGKKPKLFTFYAQVYDQDVADYFCDVMLSSLQSQRRILTAMVRFARDNGFVMPERENDPIELAKQREQKRKKMILTRKKMAKRNG